MTEQTQIFEPGRPRITFLIPGLSVGGAERHTVDLRARLGGLGYETSLVVHGRRKSETILAEPGAHGAILLNLKGMSDLRGWLRVYETIRAEAPDIIFCVNQMPLIVAVVVRLFGATRARIAGIFHTTVLQENEKRLFFLFRWAVRQADATVFVGANQKAYWVENGLACARMPVIRNGIDFERFKPEPAWRNTIRATFGLAPEDLVIGMVAAFRVEKNHKDLIDAVALLKAKGITPKVLFVGDGPTQADIRERTADKGIASQVIFAGEQSDVRPFMAASDVGVLCSTTESMPLSALEFLAMGIPMVSTRVGGASEIIEDGVNGFLAAAGDVTDLAEKLAAVLASAELRQRPARNTQSIRETFSLQKMMDGYVALITELSAEPKKVTNA